MLGWVGKDCVNRTKNETAMARQGVAKGPRDAGTPLAVVYIPFACILDHLWRQWEDDIFTMIKTRAMSPLKPPRGFIVVIFECAGEC